MLTGFHREAVMVLRIHCLVSAVTHPDREGQERPAMGGPLELAVTMGRRLERRADRRRFGLDKEALKKQLEMNEGLKLRAYLCPAGRLTVGVGRNVEANPVDDELGRTINAVGMTITHDEAMLLLDHDVDRTVSQVRTNVPGFDELPESCQHVLVDMAFNMGLAGLLGFRNMLKAIRAGDFQKAAREMLNSKWAGQVGVRAKRLVRMMTEDKPFSAVV